MQLIAQERTLPQLKKELNEHPQQDTVRVHMLLDLSSYSFQSLDERSTFGEEALAISRAIHYPLGEGYALANMGYFLTLQGNAEKADSMLSQADLLAKQLNDPGLTGQVFFRYGNKLSFTGDKTALDYLLKAEAVFIESAHFERLALCQSVIADLYQYNLSNYPVAMQYLLKANESAEKTNSTYAFYWVFYSLGNLYLSLGEYDNALLYYQKAGDAAKKFGVSDQTAGLLNTTGEVYRLTGNYTKAIEAYQQSMKSDSSVLYKYTNEGNLADVYTRINNLPLAFQYGLNALALAKQYEDSYQIAWIHGMLARAYLKKGLPDSAIFHALPGLDVATKSGNIEGMRDNSEALANAYADKKDFSQAYKYHLEFTNYRDSMLNKEIRNRTAVLKYNNDLAKKQAQITQLSQQQKIQQAFLITTLVALALILITAGLLFYNNRQKQKANQKIEKAYFELRSAQAQLVQSEKMASLGELTAGIAHEIQNPLNFVNNFSEVNNELIGELESEANKGNLSEVKVIAKNIKENGEKINHHGKRADAIVKSMLQHSRVSSGQKELTDISALCEEYLRLAYHGIRAKDKFFNAKIETDFDPSLPEVNIVSQDMARVILNLVTNAFHAVGEKAKENIPGYEPTVAISTKSLDGKIQITVQDNGVGIPEKIKDKIFHPFFSTKPTGQGTGLGLSVSYDIVKAHGGSIQVTSEAGKGSDFLIVLPV
jgi:signal transduction histidine kinase/tetratricopeptide (TPR) repeat protein